MKPAPDPTNSTGQAKGSTKRTGLLITPRSEYHDRLMLGLLNKKHGQGSLHTDQKRINMDDGAGLERRGLIK